MHAVLFFIVLGLYITVMHLCEPSTEETRHFALFMQWDCTGTAAQCSLCMCYEQYPYFQKKILTQPLLNGLVILDHEIVSLLVPKTSPYPLSPPFV